MTDPTDYYGCEGQEHIHATEIEDVLVELLEDYETLADIRQAAPFTVIRYQHVEVCDSWLERAADRLLEDFGQAYDEEFGSPDAFEDSLLNGAAMTHVKPDIVKALRHIATESGVWLMRKVERIEIGAERAVEVAREEWPEIESGIWAESGHGDMEKIE